MPNKEEMSIVTEVGVFGSLNIDDPTVKKVKKKDDGQDMELDSLIEAAIEHNRNI